MPTSSELLDWNEENFTKVVSDLYEEAGTDPSLHQKILANPLEVLSARIAVPAKYEGGIFAREKGKDVMMLYVPTSGQARASMPAGTTDEAAKPDFEPLCTVETLW